MATGRRGTTAGATHGRRDTVVDMAERTAWQCRQGGSGASVAAQPTQHATVVGKAPWLAYLGQGKEAPR
jgi:hypothetical protein